MKKISILGSTGSIGLQAAAVVRKYRNDFSVRALASSSNIEELKKQILEFRPEVVSIQSETLSAELKGWCRSKGVKTRVVSGDDGLNCDIVLSAVVGFAGLKPLLAAINKGRTIALANKEALVVAGDIIIKKAKSRKSEIIPVDSEHSAIFQCLKNENGGNIRRILLTASGGPFYRSKKPLSEITAKHALEHPTWKMGRKITIDSATLMNKGLEAIEAHHLFGTPIEKIQIVIHPQSIIHSMVEFADSSVIAQMSYPDMKLPIQYALTYPERRPSDVRPLDLFSVAKLEFGKPDFRKFRCLELALAASSIGGTMPAVMNAANEESVRLFLDGAVSFTDIPKLIERAMKAHKPLRNPALDDIFESDRAARASVVEGLRGLKRLKC